MVGYLYSKKSWLWLLEHGDLSEKEEEESKLLFDLLCQSKLIVGLCTEDCVPLPNF